MLSKTLPICDEITEDTLYNLSKNPKNSRLIVFPRITLSPATVK